MIRNVVRVGSRKSALALKQTSMVVEAIKLAQPDVKIEIIELITTGDFRRDKLNLQVLDKKQWIIELERAILSEEIDFAVHSGKDVPLNLEIGTSITSVLNREDPRDVLIALSGEQVLSSETPLNFLKHGAKVGTSSKRRKAQLLRLRPDLEVVQCRGNITTRIEKVLDKLEYDAIIIAQAGVNRLQVNSGYYQNLMVSQMVPAVCQGTLVCQFKSSQEEIAILLSKIVDEPTQSTFLAERILVEELGADCHSSLGVFASIDGKDMRIQARVCSVDGTEEIDGLREGSVTETERVAKELAKELKEKGALNYL